MLQRREPSISPLCLVSGAFRARQRARSSSDRMLRVELEAHRQMQGKGPSPPLGLFLL